MSTEQQIELEKQPMDGTWVNPDAGATEAEFKKHVLSSIPEEISDGGETIKPQEIALEAFRDSKARMAAGKQEQPHN
ncbi:hypothetical protein HZB74_01730 [Candidatus Saccharibacteria bacterium]|nr:hypothetical protein [Candidatus Saccharibacteria bacterium]